ncbi:glycosyltransferase family A protein [Psychroflexus sp. MBR-150]|jgi:glycosyltransferase involved in cell wall biosynthesis
MIQTSDIEFLISTMNRSDFDFLEKMFKYHNLSDLNILIINQTTKDKILKTNRKNIRVVNVFEKGLSKSRNLAIKHAKAKICFIADDDIEYLPNAIDTVIQAYQDYPDAALISFQFLRENNQPYKIYKSQSGYQNRLLHQQSLSSIEISFNLKLVRNNDIAFNNLFGLWARFVCAEESVFRDDIIRKHLKVVYIDKPIVKHYGKTTEPDEGSKAYTQALTAQKYLQHKNLIYLWLMRYIWLLLKRKVIKPSQISQIWNYGVTAVQDYKKLSSEQ